MHIDIHELNDAELDHVNGGSFLSTLKDGAAAIVSAAGALQEVGYAAACQADPFTCRPD